MDKINTNKLDMSSRVVAENTTDAQCTRHISITGGYHALSQLCEALKSVLDSRKAQANVKGLQDYNNLKTTVQIRLKDWD